MLRVATGEAWQAQWSKWPYRWSDYKFLTRQVRRVGTSQTYSFLSKGQSLLSALCLFIHCSSSSRITYLWTVWVISQRHNFRQQSTMTSNISCCPHTSCIYYKCNVNYSAPTNVKGVFCSYQCESSTSPFHFYPVLVGRGTYPPLLCFMPL